MKFALGVDLGQVNDPSAIVVVEKRVQPWARTTPDEAYPGDLILVRHVERLALRTSYPDVVRHVAALLEREPLRGQTELIVDHTGVGRAPVDMMREAKLTPLAINITTGGTEQRAAPHPTNAIGMDRNVPKKELVAVLRVLFESRPQRLKIASGLAFADALVKELSTFRQKLRGSGYTAFEALREGDHDDLVLALGLAAWWAVKSALGPLAPVRPLPMSTEYYKAEAERFEAARFRNLHKANRRRTDEDDPWEES
jgi:hypothetical protein